MADRNRSEGEAEERAGRPGLRPSAGSGPSAGDDAEALRISASRYRDVFRYMRAGVAIYEAVGGGRDFVLRDLNPAGERISRIGKDQALGRSLLEIFPNMDTYGLLDALRRVYRTGAPEHLPAAYYEDDQRRGWRENFLFKLPNGEVAGIYEDITERKEAEAALRASEERLAILFTSAPDAYYLNDLKGRFIDGNLAAERLLGFPKAELIGRSFLKLKILPGRFLAKAAKLLAKNALGRPTGPDEFVLKRKDGSSSTVEIRTHPVKIEGRTLVLAIARDITERKRIEARERELAERLRRQEKSAAIATLAGGIAHEINNPLNGIMNYAQLIADEPETTGRQRQYAAEIIRETRRAANIVRSLLSLTQPAPKSKLPLPAAEIIQGVAEAAETGIRDRRIRFEVEIPPGLPRLLCNPPQVQFALLSLVLNAEEALADRPAGAEGSGRIRVVAGEVRRPGGRFVRITVEDDGPGIPPEVRERIFDPFFTTRSRATHSGLGLAVSRRIAEEHGGCLKVESEPGRGARFHLELPAEAEDETGRRSGTP